MNYRCWIKKQGIDCVTNQQAPGTAMSIGENLRAKREASGLSQKALAALIETAANTYIGWEHDKNPPPADKVALLARVFRCSTDELIFEKSDRSVTEDMRAVFRRFDALPNDMKPQARMMLRAMLLSLEEEAAKREDESAA